MVPLSPPPRAPATHLAPVEKGRSQHAPGAAEAVHRTSDPRWERHVLSHGKALTSWCVSRREWMGCWGLLG